MALGSRRHFLPVFGDREQEEYGDDRKYTQCSPGIFAIRITPTIQRNNFIFTNASLKQCDRIRISGTKTFQVHLAHRAYLSVRSGLQPLS